MISAVTQPLKRFLDPKLLGQVLIVGTMTVGVKIVAFLKEIVVAHQFGTSDQLDAFLVALLIPTVIAFVVGDAFRDAAIPVYAKLRAGSDPEAPRLVSNILWLCGGTLFAVSLGALAFSGTVIDLLANEFPEEKKAQSAQFLRLLFPFAICFGLGAVVKGYLQAHGRFSISSAAPAAVPACIIILLLLASGPPNSALLAIGASLGTLLYFTILCTSSKNLKNGRLLKKPGWDAQTKSVVRHTLPLLAGAAVMEGCYFVDTMMATSLASGSVATLSYGERICTIVLTIAGTAAGQAFFPHVSDLVAREEWKSLTRVVIRFSTLIVTLALPFILFFQIASEPVVRLLLERGEFTSEDTVRVAEVLRFASFQIPGYILAVLGARVVMALRGSRFMLLTTLLVLSLNVALNLLFIRWFGLKGIALSTAVVSLVSATMLYLYIAVRIRRFTRTGSGT